IGNAEELAMTMRTSFIRRIRLLAVIIAAFMAAAPALAVVPPVNATLGPSQRIQFINGRTLASLSFIVRVTPQTAGIFTIPDVAPNGEPLVLRVTPPGGAPGPGAPGD